MPTSVARSFPRPVQSRFNFKKQSRVFGRVCGTSLLNIVLRGYGKETRTRGRSGGRTEEWGVKERGAGEGGGRSPLAAAPAQAHHTLPHRGPRPFGVV